MRTTRKKIIAIFVITLVVGGGAYLFLAGERGEKVGERGEKGEEKIVKVVKVSGVVIDPVTDSPVSNVDLVVGDMSIRTQEAGRFVFTKVGTKTGIRLTHPELLRAIVKLPVYPRVERLVVNSSPLGLPDTRAAEQVTDILFNVLLYNTLIEIVDREARGNLDAVYDHLAPQIKEKLSREVFREEFGSMFTEEDITNQEIVIRGMRRTPDYYNRQLDLRFSNIIEFELVNGENSKWYALIYREDAFSPLWQLIY